VNTIGKRLRALRAQLGDPPQRQVAEQAGVSIRSYSSWESDSGRPNFESATKLASLFDSSPEWILYGATDSPDRLAAVERKLDLVLKILESQFGWRREWGERP